MNAEPSLTDDRELRRVFVREGEPLPVQNTLDFARGFNGSIFWDVVVELF